MLYSINNDFVNGTKLSGVYAHGILKDLLQSCIIKTTEYDLLEGYIKVESNEKVDFVYNGIIDPQTDPCEIFVFIWKTQLTGEIKGLAVTDNEIDLRYALSRFNDKSDYL